MNIEQIAQEITVELGYSGGQDEVLSVLKLGLSKLAEQAGEPVAKVISHARMTSQSTTLDRPIRAGVNLYTEASQIAAQQRTAEACAKLVMDNLLDYGGYEHAETIRNGEWREYL